MCVVMEFWKCWNIQLYFVWMLLQLGLYGDEGGRAKWKVEQTSRTQGFKVVFKSMKIIE